MTTRSTWASGSLGSVSDVALDTLRTAVDAAKAQADAAKAQAAGAASTASSAASSATSAMTTAGTAVASVDQLNQAVARGEAAHQVFTDAIAALQARVQTIGLAYGTLAALLVISNSVDVTLTLSRDMGRTDYNVEPASIVGAQVTVKSRTKTSVVLTVKAQTAALAVGTPILAVAWI